MDRGLVICTICARGGSKGVKNKNLRPLLGRPLLEYSIEQARRSDLFSEIAVSSDSDDILECAELAGATQLVERPAELATDSAAKVPVIRHCVETVENRLGRRFEICVDLDATSPLRLTTDIRDSVQLLIEKAAQNIITGARARRSPYFNLVERKPDGTIGLSKVATPPLVRRQDAPIAYDMNASIYIWRREALSAQPTIFGEKTYLFEMPEERSLDIDSELDFSLVEFIAKRDGRFRDVW